MPADAAAPQRRDNERPTYRWVDEKGVIHYGDRIPPQYARSEAAVLNKQGVAVAIRPAQKTPEQLEQEARQRAAAEREQQHDRFLLSTYQSVRDIENLRDERLQQIAGFRQSTQAYVDSLEDRLAALHTRAQLFRPYNSSANARRMPDELAEDLVRTMNEVRTQEAQMAARLAEEKAVRAQFQSDIERFRFLKQRMAASAR
ncbi:MAG: DUF4124 domain-containing protein [Steroidobacteraceae bacterium]|nr:DUF4124 domain-containing protein [Steroidobacteraceae bacterium]